jgi:heptaprenylglyceryl phosphate synthase
MAILTRVNPVSTTTNWESSGKDLQFFTVDYVNAINGSAGPEGAQAAVLSTIGTTATIVMAGPLADTNTQQTFATEGADAVVVGTLQAAIRALGTVDSVDLTSTTVTATKLAILTAAAV